MGHRVTVLSVEEFATDGFRIVVERPEGYAVDQGQAADVSLTDEGMEDFSRPFHFRRIDDEALEFVVFAYGDADPILHRFAAVSIGDVLSLSDAYRPETRDVFFGGWRRPQVRQEHGGSRRRMN